jgi:hypothetical protein
MDKETRNLLFNTTQAIRRLLEEEFSLQLEGTFDVHADGRVAEQPGSQLSASERLVRCRIVEAIQHRRAVGEPAADSVRGFQVEVVFTCFNRLAALRMMEARGLVLPCVSQGDQSQGFKEFSGLAPGLVELPDKGYRLYLECLFDEIGREVGVLFDRTDAASQLWPRRKALEAVLAKLNTPELAGVWAEDETIGWIYQYFNDETERKKMREESSAPRNSRELAVRNQFFTPRYVVEFLTDNTLGRLWYEMTRSETVLRDCCRYLVRRPTEIFLKPGKSAPESAAGSEAESLSQEELLLQPVHIPHRPLKDPREIRLLDPACGSMHFGLYAFDLFTVIYDEAWEIAHGPDAAAKSAETFAPFVTFAATFPDKAAFLREVPRLIVEHNIHGIDIDPRAAQIAGLSLWLRAQRAWHQAGVKPADRPRINRSNLVCAEPMPGEKELLREFVEQQFPPGERPIFQHFLESVFEKMKLAGEAGSLLRIEEEIRSAIDEARAAWAKIQSRPLELFSTTEINRVSRAPELTGLESALATDHQPLSTDFWQAAEQRIYDALEAYAEQAENGGGFQRRLFADDAAQGFAFIDLCRKRYDVAVMNPPFGLFTELSLAYAKLRYPAASNDFYAAFVIRALELTNTSGAVGVISSRLGFFLEGLQDWRENLMCGEAVLRVVADLGYGVLDALVETAAYVIDKRVGDDSFTALSALSSGDKDATVTTALNAIVNASASRHVHVSHHKALRALPGAVIAYWLPDNFVARMLSFEKVSDTDVSVFSGLQTDDDFRFLRLAWEAPIDGAYEDWFPFAKGGEYQPFADDLHLVVKWTANGSEMKQFVASIYENWSRHIKNTERYFRSGLTYTERTTSDISIRAFPARAIFSVSGPVVQSEDPSNLYCAWALFTSRVGRALIEMAVGSGDTSKSGTAARHYRTGILKECFWPQLGDESQATVKENLETLFRQNSDKLRAAETHRLFVPQNLLKGDSFEADGKARLVEELNRFVASLSSSLRIDTLISQAFGLTASDVDQLGGPHPSSFTGVSEEGSAAEVRRLLSLGEEELCAESLKRGVHPRTATKKNYTYSQQLELIAAITRLSPQSLRDIFVQNEHFSSARNSAASDAISVAIGCIFGRWDIRYATGERPAPELPDPFAPLPVCPPGMLQGEDGLPLSPEAGRRLRTEGRYPFDVAWDGILVDDPNHPADVVGRVQEVSRVLWKDRADALEHEVCALLGVPALREWFRRPAGFFADHLKRYSKSRRQAPIYWPLSSPKNLYTVWLYYHRLTPDTLFTVLRDHVKPRLEFEERRAFQLQQEAGPTPSPSQRRDLADATDLVEDIRAFKAELERVAPLFHPNLNDGVIINHAPLWRLAAHPKWRKDCHAIWNELAQGDYDWAHLAMHLWPERVVPKCATDRSLAIAHGLDAIFWREDPEKPGKWIARKVTDLELRGLIAERTSAAVKAAVEELRVSGQHQGSEGSGRVQRRGSASAGGARKRGKKASTQEEELL